MTARQKERALVERPYRAMFQIPLLFLITSEQETFLGKI
jgi:hypothetical protein